MLGGTLCHLPTFFYINMCSLLILCSMCAEMHHWSQRTLSHVDILMHGPVQESKDLSRVHHNMLDCLGCPDYEELCLCDECGSAYTSVHIGLLRDASPDHIARCTFIPLPNGSTPDRRRACGKPLEAMSIERPHGREGPVWRPIKALQHFDYGLWLYRLCSFHRSDSDLFRYAGSRAPPTDPDIMTDIMDGDGWAPFQERWCGEPDTTFLLLQASFDFISPFQKDHRSNEETKKKKVHFAYCNSFIVIPGPCYHGIHTGKCCNRLSDVMET